MRAYRNQPAHTAQKLSIHANVERDVGYIVRLNKQVTEYIIFLQLYM